MSEFDLNWFVRHSTELFPEAPKPILPLRDCVQIVDGKRVLVCAILGCPAKYELQAPKIAPKSAVLDFLDSLAPRRPEILPSGIANNAVYLCRQHNPKPAQGVFFQEHAFDRQFISIGKQLLRTFDNREPFMQQGHQ